MSIGCRGRNTPSIVGRDGKAKIDLYEFHCWIEMFRAGMSLKHFTAAEFDYLKAKKYIPSYFTHIRTLFRRIY